MLVCNRAFGWAAVATGSLALLAGGCGSEGGDASSRSRPAAGRLPQGAEPVRLDPADFTTKIDNPYWPMAPGSRWVVRVVEGRTPQRQVITVTDRTKRIADGVRARVVRDVVREHGDLVEVTDDWYAQDSAGNIWYFGEDTAEYENGRVTTRAGSFEAGVDGAQPGIAIPAHPKVGQSYRQEYRAGEAEDQSAVLSLDEQVAVPFGHFTRVLMTKDFTPLEPDVLEYKWYAKGVGPVLAITVSGGSAREELVSYRRHAQ